jgi:hypothetical protein
MVRITQMLRPDMIEKVSGMFRYGLRFYALLEQFLTEGYEC